MDDIDYFTARQNLQTSEGDWYMRVLERVWESMEDKCTVKDEAMDKAGLFSKVTELSLLFYLCDNQSKPIMIFKLMINQLYLSLVERTILSL